MKIDFGSLPHRTPVVKTPKKTSEVCFALRLHSLGLDTAGERRLLDQRSLRSARKNYGVGVFASGGMDIGVNVGVMVGAGVAISGAHPL